MRCHLTNGHQQEYNVFSQQSLTKSGIKYRMTHDSKPFYDECKALGMTDNEARTISKFDHRLIEQLEKELDDGNKTISHRDLMHLSMYAMGQHAQWVSSERQQLQK